MLTAGQAVHEAGGPKPGFTVPAAEEVRRYWARTGFFHHAGDLFEIHGKLPRVKPDERSEVLLEVTPVRASEDVHGVVGRIQEGAARILAGKLGFKGEAIMGFAMALSEACQNIVEHAGTGGWVAVHAYDFRRRQGRWVMVIAVSDAGIGFRRSLEATQARRLGDRWSDATALEDPTRPRRCSRSGTSSWGFSTFRSCSSRSLPRHATNASDPSGFLTDPLRDRRLRLRRHWLCGLHFAASKTGGIELELESEPDTLDTGFVQSSS